MCTTSVRSLCHVNSQSCQPHDSGDHHHKHSSRAVNVGYVPLVIAFNHQLCEACCGIKICLPYWRISLLILHWNKSTAPHVFDPTKTSGQRLKDDLWLGSAISQRKRMSFSFHCSILLCTKCALGRKSCESGIDMDSHKKTVANWHCWCMSLKKSVICSIALFLKICQIFISRSIQLDKLLLQKANKWWLLVTFDWQPIWGPSGYPIGRL